MSVKNKIKKKKETETIFLFYTSYLQHLCEVDETKSRKEVGVRYFCVSRISRMKRMTLLHLARKAVSIGMALLQQEWRVYCRISHSSKYHWFPSTVPRKNTQTHSNPILRWGEYFLFFSAICNANWFQLYQNIIQLLLKLIAYSLFFFYKLEKKNISFTIFQKNISI